MPISELKGFLHALDDYERGDAQREGIAARRVGEPRSRHLVSRLFNLFVQRLVLPGIETRCGLRCSARPLQAILPHATVNGWAFGVRCAPSRANGLRIVEVPVVGIAGSRGSQSSRRRQMLREILAIGSRALGFGEQVTGTEI